MTRPAIGLLGTGSYLPERRVSNEEIAARVPDVTPEWIVRKTAIRSRRFAADHEATSDLAAKAVSRALEHAGLPPGRVDYLIVATSTGDFPQPPTASIVQGLTATTAAACLDINVVCTGFVYALELARCLVSANPGTHAVVAGADVYSRILDFGDRRTAILFGDGAGAAVVGEVQPGYGIIDVELGTRGDAEHLIKVPAGGSRCPASARTVADGGHYFTMRGRDVREFVLGNVPAVLEKLLARAGTGLAEIDCFVPHQANGVLLGELAGQCGLADTHTHLVLDRYGNIGSASVPVALDDAVRSGVIGDGSLVLLAAFGGGMSVGGALLRWCSPSEGMAR
ncbi:MAG TPA: ketoacyl-ACP synthase III [Pseudonocardiaceae bacterium]|jgi:3-oxoacyl-[acyl-carrier-protein] synthase-3